MTDIPKIASMDLIYASGYAFLQGYAYRVDRIEEWGFEACDEAECNCKAWHVDVHLIGRNEPENHVEVNEAQLAHFITCFNQEVKQ